jgi:hypothetical protein
MGDGITGQISKGPVHRAVDAYLNARNEAGQLVNRAGFLGKLTQAQTWTQYLEILEKDVGLSAARSNYLRARWYDTTDPNIAWPTLQPIYPVLRRGLIKALQEAGSTLLLDSYWMPVASTVSVIVTRSPGQVTRIILTPPSPMPTADRVQEAPMWVVRRQETPAVTPGTARHDEVAEAVDPDVVTWRRRE